MSRGEHLNQAVAADRGRGIRTGERRIGPGDRHAGVGTSGSQLQRAAALRASIRGRLFGVGGQLGRQGLEQLRREGLANAAFDQLHLIRQADAIGGEHTSQRMQQHPLHPQGLGHGAGVLTAGTTEAAEHGITQIAPLLDRNAPDRLGHPLHRNRQGPFCHLFGRWHLRRPRRWTRTASISRGSPQHTGQLLEAQPRRQRIKALIAAWTEHRRHLSRLQTPQQQVGVGDRERATAAVTGGAWIRAGRFRPHLQPQAIEADPRATAGRHGVDLQHRRLQRQTAELALLAPLPGGRAIRSCLTPAHIGGGAAHVEAHQGREAGRRADAAGPHQATRRSGEDRVLGAQLLRRDQATARLHHPQRHLWPKSRLHLGQIALQHRPDTGLQRSGVGPRHQPRQRAHLMREGDGLEAERLQPGAECQLMAREAVGVQQGHGDAAEPIGTRLMQLLGQSPIALQRLQLRAIRRQAATNLQHPPGQGLRPPDLQGKQIGPVLIADGQQIGEAAVEQQQRRPALALQQRICGHGGAQAHLGDQPGGNRLSGAGIEPQEPADRPHRRIPRNARLHRQQLAHQQPSLRTARHQVGEGASAIDPEAPASGHQR